MVVDFGRIKELIGDYMAMWDHALVMPSTMPAEYLQVLLNHNRNLLVVNYNPTAENMARDMAEGIWAILFLDRDGRDGVQLTAVRVHETETGYAEWRRVG